jgi:hypothetical protein
MTGRVLSLHLGTGSGLPKPQVEALDLLAGFGALGDRHAGKDPDRALLVAGIAAYEKAKRAGIHLPFGALGENLLLDLDPHLLPPGARLRVGEALLELTQVCTVCNSLSQFDLRLPKLLYGAGASTPGSSRAAGCGWGTRSWSWWRRNRAKTKGPGGTPGAHSLRLRGCCKSPPQAVTRPWPAASPTIVTCPDRPRPRLPQGSPHSPWQDAGSAPARQRSSPPPTS